MTRSTLGARHTSHAFDAHPTARSGTFRRAPIRQVLERPDPRLSHACLEVDPRAPAILEVAELLVATMSASPARIGLAAPQIGEMLRVLCVDVTGHPWARSCAGLIVLANPRIVHRAGNVVMIEDCASVPHLTGPVARAEEVTVEGVVPGTTRRTRVSADGVEARCLLHELDHLDGYVLADRMLEASTSRAW